jgi:hypothetical protein
MIQISLNKLQSNAKGDKCVIGAATDAESIKSDTGSNRAICIYWNVWDACFTITWDPYG